TRGTSCSHVRCDYKYSYGVLDFLQRKAEIISEEFHYKNGSKIFRAGYYLYKNNFIVLSIMRSSKEDLQLTVYNSTEDEIFYRDFDKFKATGLKSFKFFVLVDDMGSPYFTSINM